VIPLAAAAVGLYWLFKPPLVAYLPSDSPESAAVMSMDADNVPAPVATVHAAPMRIQNRTGE
jgi:hypothetical protein